MTYQKSWAVVGFTHDGAVFCPECVVYCDPTITGDSATDTREELPKPIFASDEIPEYWYCLICEFPIN